MKRVENVRQHLETTKDVLTFGKYKDHVVENVLVGDPSYLEWAWCEHVVTCSKEVEDAIQDKLTYK